jgi:hypothetical protein
MHIASHDHSAKAMCVVDELHASQALVTLWAYAHRDSRCLQVQRFDVRFIMKADDDAFVNVPALIAELKANCVTPGCRRERMYFGREIRNNVVRPANNLQTCL